MHPICWLQRHDGLTTGYPIRRVSPRCARPKHHRAPHAATRCACRTSRVTAARVVHMGRQSEPALGSKGPRGGAAVLSQERSRGGAVHADSKAVAHGLSRASARVPADTRDCRQFIQFVWQTSAAARLRAPNCGLGSAGSGGLGLLLMKDVAGLGWRVGMARDEERAQCTGARGCRGAVRGGR